MLERAFHCLYHTLCVTDLTVRHVITVLHNLYVRNDNNTEKIRDVAKEKKPGHTKEVCTRSSRLRP